MTELLSDTCRWLVKEEDAEAVGGETTNRHWPLTNEPSWRLLVLPLLPLRSRSVVATTIARASATVGQGGPSNLQRFKAHHQPTFKGGEDPMDAIHWLRQVSKILEGMEIISDATRIRLVAFQPEGES